MKLKALLILAFVIGMCYACKQDEIVTPAMQAGIDDAIIQEYLKTNNIEGYTKTPSGLYYIVIDSSQGPRAATGTRVWVDYVGTYLNGDTFDLDLSGKVTSGFVVGGTGSIYGFSEGLTLLRKEERALIILPSGLAYGQRGTRGIPPNTILRFELSRLRGF
jgi:FKBP-type peptidyl-prolyl cis-trans isomerase FkpA